MQRSRSVVALVACILFVTTTLLILERVPLWFGWQQIPVSPGESVPINAGTPSATGDGPKNDVEPAVELEEDPAINETTITVDPSLYTFPRTLEYVQAILNPADADVIRLKCPAIDASRYGYLRAGGTEESHELKYFFALDLRKVVDLLPRLLGSIVETIRFLGPAACALSIVEGASQGDGTRDVLEALQPELRRLGIRYYLRESRENSRMGDRIKTLAQLRNMALAPLVHPDDDDGNGNDETKAALTTTPLAMPPATGDTTVLFLNDVAACPGDLLELAHQRVFQSADMTCGMDWTSSDNRAPIFYDAWVARALNGGTFFEVPPSGDWSRSWDLFWNDAGTRERYLKNLPFQVFACWNGGVAFGAGPLLGLPPPAEEAAAAPPSRVEFRTSRAGRECRMGEPTLFCKDLWRRGYGRIAVVPTVNFEYSDEAGLHLKGVKGFAARLGAHENVGDTRIRWQAEPPEKILCMPEWARQSWVPWDE
ncbi:alpha-1,3-mannosyltransferase CMT1 [Xylariomycetidae sp. FL2044]|nr:alpha-1,3-mannosyltransferase CMT1 [Xylariomycetidae sp. FL2044]